MKVRLICIEFFGWGRCSGIDRAILSKIETGRIASRFGYHADENDLAAGLKTTPQADRWREKGEAGFRWVRESFELADVIDEQVAVYGRLVAAMA